MSRESGGVERADEAVERMSGEKKTETCPLCSEEHESASLYGVKYIACPFMPEDTIMPKATLDAFFQGHSMLDQPVIVITK